MAYADNGKPGRVIAGLLAGTGGGLAVVLAVVLAVILATGCQQLDVRCTGGATCYVDSSQDRGGNNGTAAASVGAAGGSGGQVVQPQAVLP